MQLKKRMFWIIGVIGCGLILPNLVLAQDWIKTEVVSFPEMTYKFGPPIESSGFRFDGCQNAIRGEKDTWIGKTCNFALEAKKGAYVYFNVEAIPGSGHTGGCLIKLSIDEHLSERVDSFRCRRNFSVGALEGVDTDKYKLVFMVNDKS